MPQQQILQIQLVLPQLQQQRLLQLEEGKNQPKMQEKEGAKKPVVGEVEEKKKRKRHPPKQLLHPLDTQEQLPAKMETMGMLRVLATNNCY
jgi:hypothetical protein